LRERLESLGHEVIESYPGGVQDLLGWPRKSGGTERLRRSMRSAGFSGSVALRSTTHDELDAVACALSGLQWLRGRALVLGDQSEGEIVLAHSLPPMPRPRGNRLAFPPA
jgi:predicted RNase H-like nuclease